MSNSALCVSNFAARVATQTLFFVSGFLFATWGVHVPTVKAAYALSAAELSGLMLAVGIGALIGLSRVGHWVARHGARSVVLASGVLAVASLGLLLEMPGFAALVGLLFFFGLSFGAFDVAINAEAVAVEQRYRRPIMSSFHGFFSLGGMIGAATGAAMLWLAVPPTLHLAATAAGGWLATLLAAHFMLPASATHSPTDAGQAFSLPRGPVLLLGLLAACGLVGEGALYDWSALYMVTLGADQGKAALAYGAFSGAMAAGRFVGDAVRARLGIARTLAASSWLAALAMTATLWVGHPSFTLIGFALVGLGFSNIIPVLFSGAASIPGVSPARGIAGVSGCGYLGMMLGPPLIGAVATQSSLGWGLGVVALGAACVAGLAPRAARSMA